MPTTEQLKAIPFFAPVADADLGALAEKFREVEVPAGKAIFRVGDKGASFFVVRSGRVRIWLTDEDRKEHTLAVFDAGEFFGELSLVDGLPRSANATALDETKLLSLERDDFVKMLEERPKMAIGILTSMSKRLRETDAYLRSRASKNVNEEEEEQLTFGERVADSVAAFGGSWGFIGVFAIILFGWMALNSIEFLLHAFDPAPFIGLNLILSCLAALQAPFIMMSQNRQAAKDRLRADVDFAVNLKNEVSLDRTLGELKEIRELEFGSIRERVERLERLLAESPSPGKR